MTNNTKMKPLAFALGAALVGGVAGMGTTSAESLFSMGELSSGYMQLAEGSCGEGKCGGDDKAKEGSCGEDKSKEGSCGEGKCGGEDKAKEGSCGEGKSKEGSCGEGKCGGES